MINLIIKPDIIKLPAGTVVRVPGTWQDYLALQQSLGDRTSPRLKYHQGELKLMVPLPEHGKQLDVVVDLVKVLLYHRGLPFDSYHETTIELPDGSGIIPGHFFYLVNFPSSVSGGSTGEGTHHRIWRSNWMLLPSPVSMTIFPIELVNCGLSGSSRLLYTNFRAIATYKFPRVGFSLAST
jgi:hypothetical protein